MTWAPRQPSKSRPPAAHLGDADVLEVGREGDDLDVVRVDDPGERRVVEDVGSKVGERALVGDRELGRRLVVGHALVRKRADGRQRDRGDVAALPDDAEAVGDLDLRVERSLRRSARPRPPRPTHRIEQLTLQGDLEALTRDLGDVAVGEGQRRLVDNVLDDGLADGADQVEQRLVRVDGHVKLVEVERRGVVVERDLRLDLQGDVQVAERGEDGVEDVELLTARAGRVDGDDGLVDRRRDARVVGDLRVRETDDEADATSANVPLSTPRT